MVGLLFLYEEAKQPTRVLQENVKILRFPLVKRQSLLDLDNSHINF